MYDRDGRDAINVDDFVGFCVFVDPSVDPVVTSQRATRMPKSTRLLTREGVQDLRKSVMVEGDWIKCEPFCEWLATYATSLTPTLRSTFMNI